MVQPADADPVAKDVITMTTDAVEFFVQDVVMESRRVMLDPTAVNRLIAESLMRRGMDPAKLAHARWLWVGVLTGQPHLCLILPGIEA